MADRPSAEPEDHCSPSKSGIEGPAGYNGKAPSSIAAPVKEYPGSKSIGQGADKSGRGGGTVVGPRSSKSKD